ncbi:MAG: hypothetical protein M3R17_10095, partial [Bacteroidota bacterium]|nr:hypothetical protein [Bacteroidota bacterium]
MKKYSYAFTFLLLFILQGAIYGQAYFQHTYSNIDYEAGSVSIITADGGYLIGGTSGTSPFGLSKIFLVKTDVNGTIQWTKNYGGSVSEYLASIIQNPDGSYILVGTTFSFNTQPYGNLYMLKTDVNGTLLWSKHFGLSGYDYGYSVQQTSDGGYIIGGLTSSIGAGYYDYYILKTDANGNGMWATSIGGGANDQGYSIAILDDGSYLVAGQSNSFGPPQQMVVPYLMLLCKLDVSGNVMWSKTYSAGGNCICQQMIKTADGGCIMAGWTDGAGAGVQDIYVVKTDSAGNAQWSKVIGAANGDFSLSVCENPAGGYMLGGYTESSGAGGQDMLLVSLDAAGTINWATTYG